MTFNPINGTLLINGTEVNIPAIRQGTLADLATATVRTPNRSWVDPGVFICNESKIIGGVMPWGSDLIVSAYCYFDSGTEQRSHWRVANGGAGAATGPVQVGTSGAGFVSAWMTPIPVEWQGLLGGPALTGQGSIPVISRTSSGPAASVFNPADIGVKNPVPATPVVGYPHSDSGSMLTLGTVESNGTLWNSTQWMGGMVFPNGTRSILFFAGRKAKGQFCYGPGTTDQSLHMTTYPGAPLSEKWCYDPVNLDKGTHGYPYAHFVYAYDANDLVAAKNGQKAIWQVVPYATWEFDLPLQYAQRVIRGVGYDPVTKRVFLAAENGDGDNPLIHVLEVDLAVSTPPTEICGDGVDNDSDGLIDEGCTTPPPPPPAGVQSVSITFPSPVVGGQTSQIVATVLDAAGAPMAGVTITYGIEHAALATADANGLMTTTWGGVWAAEGRTQGATGVWATAGGVTSPVKFLTVLNPATAPPPPPPPPADTAGPSVIAYADPTLSVTDSLIALAADALDNVGVVGVQFTINGAAYGAEDLTAPYVGSWRPAVAGSYQIGAVARDAAGNSTPSAPVAVTINPRPAPPPVDPCTANPGFLSVSQWPSPEEGSRRLTYSYTVNGAVTKVQALALTFGPPNTLTVVDVRGCSAMVTR
jgi:hypothetical protein